MRSSLELSEMTNVAQLTIGDQFGELALMTGAPRQATTQAAMDTELMTLDRRMYMRCLRNEANSQIMLRAKSVQGLQLFAGQLQWQMAVRLAYDVQEKDSSANTVLLKQGDVAQEMHIIQTGEACMRMSVRPSGERSDQVIIKQECDADLEAWKRTRDIHRGIHCPKRHMQLGIVTLHSTDSFGEYSIVTDTPARYTVLTNSVCKLYTLGRAPLLRLIKNNKLTKVVLQLAQLSEDRFEERAQRGLSARAWMEQGHQLASSSDSPEPEPEKKTRPTAVLEERDGQETERAQELQGDEVNASFKPFKLLVAPPFFSVNPTEVQAVSARYSQEYAQPAAGSTPRAAASAAAALSAAPTISRTSGALHPLPVPILPLHRAATNQAPAALSVPSRIEDDASAGKSTVPLLFSNLNIESEVKAPLIGRNSTLQSPSGVPGSWRRGLELTEVGVTWQEPELMSLVPEPDSETSQRALKRFRTAVNVINAANAFSSTLSDIEDSYSSRVHTARWEEESSDIPRLHYLSNPHTLTDRLRAPLIPLQQFSPAELSAVLDATHKDVPSHTK
eukprot:gene9228-10933_t